MSQALLRTEGVVKRFGGITALQGVSVAVPANSIFGIVGPNGAGKSVLFNVITGFLAPDGGRVWLADRELTGLPPHLVATRGLARTFQEPRIIRSLTCLQNVLLAQLPKGLLAGLRAMVGHPWAPASADQRRTAAEALRAVGLAEKANSAAGMLSYGQQKLLALACAISLHPQVVLLDEPTAGVNPRTIDHLLDRITALHREGMTFVIVEHNMKVITSLCSRVLVLSQGRPLAEGTPREIQDDPRVVEAYLGA